MTSASVPPLAWADSWILIVVALGGDELVSIKSLIARADAVNHAILTFDEISFGLPRLTASGYLELTHDSAGELRIKATGRAIRIAQRNEKQSESVYQLWDRLEAEIGSTPYNEPDDQSLGRMNGFELEDYRRALGDYYSQFGS